MGISQELWDVMIYVELEPITTAEYIQVLCNKDTRVRESGTQKTFNTSFTFGNTQSPSAPWAFSFSATPSTSQPAKTTISTITYASATHPTTTITGTAPGPIYLSAFCPRQISEVEKERCNKERLCCYCRGAGYIVKNCPNVGKP